MDNPEKESLVVEAETRPEAENQGARELGLTLDEIETTVLQTGTTGFLGFFARPWRVKVAPRRSSSDLVEATVEEALEAAEGVDGSFHVEVDNNKIMLTIYPPTGNGEPVSAQEVKEHLNQIGLEYCDFDMVKELVRAPDGEPIRIGEVPPDENFDARYELQVYEDGLSAVLIIRPPRLGGAPPKKAEIKRELGEKQITEGIHWEVIENMIENEIYNEPTEIARGRPPETGEPGEIELFFEANPTPSFEDENGRVDYRELNLINNVEEDELLARINPPTPGRPGLTVRSEKIEAEPGEEKELEAGENVRCEENDFYAEISGSASLNGRELSVQNVYIVEGDVDYSTGNIEFDGTVQIEGNVHDRFKVKATGDIVVEQGVGKSYMQSDQDIIIKEGIRGKGEAQVNARGNVITEFIEQAGVIAQENIVVGEMILHSRVDAGKGIYLKGGRGLITGGEVRAAEYIIAEEVGSIGTSETRLEAGIDPGYFRNVAKIEGRIINQKEKLDKIERAINSLQGRGELGEEDEKKLEKLVSNQERLQRNIENFTEEKESLVKQATLRKDALISVAGTVHTGTRIGIGADYKLIRASDQEHCSFKLYEGRVEATAYQNISVPDF